MDLSPEHVIELFDAMDSDPSQIQAVLDKFGEYIHQDPLQFFLIFGQILNTEGLDQKYYKRLFTYSGRCVSIINQQSNALNIINEQFDGLLNALLDVAIKQIPNMPIEAGTFYGNVLLIFIEAEVDDVSVSAGLIQHLANFLEENMTPNISLGVFSAFSLIAEEAFLINSQYNCILTNTFNVLYKTEFPLDIHCKCLDTLYFLIKEAKEIIEDEENKQILFTTLLNYATQPKTKPKVYKCFGMIAKFYYTQFAEIANTIVEGALEYLSGTLDEQDQTAICHFFKSLSKTEKLRNDKGEETLNAIETTFEMIFPTFVEIVASVNSEEPFEGDLGSASSIANDALVYMILCCPETAKPLCFAFYQENVQNELFGAREAAVFVINDILGLLNDEELVEATQLILEAIPLLLEDSALRVREDCALLLMSLVYLYRNKKIYEELREHVEPFIPVLLQLSIDFPAISGSTFGAVKEMVLCKNYPVFADTVGQFLPIFESEPIDTLTGQTSTFLHVLVREESKTDAVIEAFPSMLALFEASSEPESNARKNQRDIFWILIAFVGRVGSMVVPHKDLLMKILTEEFIETGQCDSMNLLAISCILKEIKKAQVSIDEYIEITMEIAFYLMQQYGNPSDIEDAVSSLNTILPYANLTPFIPRIMELVLEGIETLRENIIAVSYLLDLTSYLLMRDLYSKAVIECGVLNVFHLACDIAASMTVDGDDSVYFANSCSKFFIEMLRQADPQAVTQWFDPIFNFAKQVYYIDNESDEIYDRMLIGTAYLLLRLVEVSQEQFEEALSQSEEIQGLLSQMISMGGEVRLHALNILRENGTPYEEEDEAE